MAPSVNRSETSKAQRRARQRQRNASDSNIYRARALIYKYGITLDDHQAQLDIQDHACAICGGEPDVGKLLHVDHDHVTGAFRGMLCGNCNRGIGNLQDSPQMLEVAAAYLRASGVLS
jgi:hypothetical protein